MDAAAAAAGDGGAAAASPAWFSEPCILGIDEAGRGPVLGSMVYAAAYCPLSAAASLKSKCARRAGGRSRAGGRERPLTAPGPAPPPPPPARAYADSKTLSEEQRERLYEQILADPAMRADSDVLSAEEISGGTCARRWVHRRSAASACPDLSPPLTPSLPAGKMLSRDKVSLNALAVDSTVRLIDRALASGVNLVEAYIDTLGDADRHRVGGCGGGGH